MGDDREMVMHVPRERERKSLASYYDVPPHHEDSKEHEAYAQDSSPDRQARQQEEDKGDEISYPVLQDEDIHEILSVYNTPEHVP